jgi:hypothetical protein
LPPLLAQSLGYRRRLIVSVMEDCSLRVFNKVLKKMLGSKIHLTHKTALLNEERNNLYSSPKIVPQKIKDTLVGRTCNRPVIN